MTNHFTELTDPQIIPQLDTLRFLNESTDDYLFYWDLQHDRLFFAGDIWARYDLPKTPDGFFASGCWSDIIHTRDRSAVAAELNEILQGRLFTHDMEYRIISRDGGKVWINCRGKVQTDENGRPLQMIGRVSETVLAAKVDLLTGLLNMDKFQEHLEEALLLGQEGYLLILGIDNFKDINMKYGRRYGNLLLQTLADALEEVSESSGHVYRLDGDQFAVNLIGQTKSVVASVYGKVRLKMRELCTLSAGAVHYDRAMKETGNTLFQYAETALEQSKKLGKDTLNFFASEDYKKRLSTIDLQSELRWSVQHNFQGFSLCYQPQISADTYRIYGAEALLRYHSPSRGSISPGEFIPLLEQTELICPVGQWVLDTALAQCRIWRESIPGFHISINVSYVQLRKKGIQQSVLRSVKKADLPGEAVALELTESIQLQDYQFFNQIFCAWQQTGIHIAIDDFGTGYSNLGYLKSLSVDEIKIDRCFVSQIQHNAYNYRLLENIFALAHSAQICVCCEGMETEEELLMLRGLRPDRLQGFLFARPYDKRTFEDIYIHRDSDAFKQRKAQEQHFQNLHNTAEAAPPSEKRNDSLEIILDKMDDVVYLSDVDTYELYYLNPAGCRIAGVSPSDYAGKKCYKVLQGLDAPCKFCTNALLKEDRFHVWDQENVHLKRHFTLKDKLIRWNGKLTRMEIAIDMTQREAMVQSIRETLHIDKSLLSYTKLLTNDSELSSVINRLLESVGVFYQAAHVSLFVLQEDESSWVNTFFWNSPETAADRHIKRIPSLWLGRWMAFFNNRESLIIQNLDILKEVSPREWRMLQFFNVCRLMAVPIFQEEKVIGFIAAANAKRLRQDDAHLKAMAILLADRIHQNETEQQVNDLLLRRYQGILKTTQLGLWILRIDPETGRNELFADQTMQDVMGIKRHLLPEECYQYWRSRINSGYYHYVKLGLRSIIETGHVVELVYAWNHPRLGKIQVRTLGRRVEDSEGKICLEGYHRILSDMDRPQFLPEVSGGEVFEFNECQNTVYFHTSGECLYGNAAKDKNFPAGWVEHEIVHPHFAEDFLDLFSQVRTQSDVQGMELLLKTQKGVYEWFKLKTKHFGKNEPDACTMTVLLNPVNPHRLIELEHLRKNDFYHALLSETTGYMEVDVESGHLITAGGIWKAYEEECRGCDLTYHQVIENHIRDMVKAEDLEGCREAIRTETLRRMHQEEDFTKKLAIRHLMDKEFLWMELVIHVFQEHATENLYALVYLRNIDMEKKKELAQILAASRDPLTNVFNRRSFKFEVNQYMTEEGSSHTGAIILLDLDNFKQINDTYGHLQGDAALKYLALTLMSTFRRRDLVGRLGGDEFMVFLKDVTDRKILDRRMAEFYEALSEIPGVPVTCSAGIALLTGERFSYEDSLKQADLALYASKRKGKNTYCYYGELDITGR